MRVSLSSLLLTLPLLALPLACEKAAMQSTAPEEAGHLGYDDPSSDDMMAISPALVESDLDGASERAMVLWKMQRAMRIGERAFAGFVGMTAAKFVALATLDPAGTSGEVAFYRWDAAQLEDGEAAAAEATRWIVVSLTLDPDEGMDPQELEVKPSAEQRRSLAALQLAQSKAAADYTDARWVAYTFRELSGDGKLRQTRVYLLGSDDKSPDLEYTVLDAAKAKKPPQVTAERMHLAPGASAKLPLSTPVSPPGPPTLARALAIATATEKPAGIVDGNGDAYEVAPKTGVLSRAQ